MSKVNKTYSHWMLQIELPLLLTSLYCCHNGEITSVQLTHSGWWLCFQKWLLCRYPPSVHKFTKYCEPWRMSNPRKKQQWLLEIEDHLLLWKWFGIINLLWWLPERKNQFDWSFLQKGKQKIPKREKQREKNTDWRGSHEKFVFTCGTSSNSVQENLLPKVLRPKINPDDSKKRMLILSWKPRWKVNSLGWWTLLVRKRTYAYFFTVFRPMHFCWHVNERNSVLESWAKWMHPFVFTYCACQVLTRKREFQNSRELTWLEYEWVGLNRRIAVTSRINIWITGSALMRMSWRLQDIGSIWSFYR